MPLPGISSGGGAIPITGGAATSGDVQSATGVDFGPVTVGGLFGSGSNSNSNMLLHIGAGIAIGFFLRRFLKR